MQLVTAAEMQQIDSYTIETIGMPQNVLIERAAMSVIDVIGAGHFNLDHILVLAGLGNNGADGIAIARLLYTQGFNVSLQFVGNVSRAKASVQQQLQIIENYGLISINKKGEDYVTMPFPVTVTLDHDYDEEEKEAEPGPSFTEITLDVVSGHNPNARGSFSPSPVPMSTGTAPPMPPMPPNSAAIKPLPFLSKKR